MNRLSAGIAAIGMGLASSGAMAYEATANVTFSWATDGVAKGWTSSAPNSLVNVANTTYFTALATNNSITYYNSDFATVPEQTAGGCGVGLEAFRAQYACKVGFTKALPTAAAGDLGPGASATGTLTATATTLTGTLTVINTNDEGAGTQAGTTAATGYNVRSADGSPFKNVWYGISSATTLTVNLTGTFNATNWEITGGTVAIADPAFQCGVADFSGVLCNPSTVSGGFNTNAEFLSWGLDASGPGGVTPIEVRDPAGTNLLSTLSGVLASLAVDGSGAITTTQGEIRNASGNNGQGCPTGSIRYNNTGISCGTLQVALLEITGTVAGAEAPDPFPFTAANNQPLSTVVTSNPVTITGLTAPADISVTGGEYSIGCTASFTSADGTINNNDTVCVRQTSSATPGTTTNTVLTVGGGSEIFAVTTIPADTTPVAFNFINQTDVPLGSVRTSNAVTITGINTAAAISVTGGQYSIGCTASFTSAPGTINDNETVCVQHTSAATGSTDTDTTLTVGGVSGTFTSTTLNVDTTPDPLTFANVTGAEPATQVVSAPVTITGINAAAPISVANGEYSVDGGAFVAGAGTVTDGQQVRVRLTSAAGSLANAQATLTVGGVPGTFTVTTREVDTTPDALVFPAVINAGLATAVTSAPVTITGITDPAPVTVANGLYSVGCTATFTGAAGTVAAGQTVCVRLTSSPTPATETVATLTVGGVAGNFSVTTVPADTTPDGFSFTAVNDAAFSTAVTSNTVTISGINTGAPISITNGQYSVNGGLFTAAGGSVPPGGTVAVRVTSAAAPSTPVSAVVTIGGESATFTVTTAAVAADPQPDAFVFTDVDNADLNTVVESNTVTITGINVASNIAISGPGGSSSEYRINGGAWTSAAGTISNNDTLQVRHTTSAVAGDAIVTVVTIGNASPAPSSQRRQAEFTSLTTPALRGGSSSMDGLALGLLGVLALLRRRRTARA